MGDPDPDFRCPLSDGVRRDRIEPHSGEDERDTRENGEHQTEHAEGPPLLGQDRIQRHDVEEGHVGLDR